MRKHAQFRRIGRKIILDARVNTQPVQLMYVQYRFLAGDEQKTIPTVCLLNHDPHAMSIALVTQSPKVELQL